jgi:hypothetical protein
MLNKKGPSVEPVVLWTIQRREKKTFLKYKQKKAYLINSSGTN